jgi:magnesium transporter
MMYAHVANAGRLVPLTAGDDLAGATWIDLYKPTPEEEAAVRALGLDVPSLADMEEIEISNRLYRVGDIDYMTAVLPGLDAARYRIASPVTFVLAPGRLVTVRHHAPRPFETYPTRADKTSHGCDSPRQVFLSLLEEIVGRLADLLESSGKVLDEVMRTAHEGDPQQGEALSGALHTVARESELLARVRLSLLTLERALSFFGQTLAPEDDPLKSAVEGLIREIQALEVHGDFLSGRIAMVSDFTLGLISVEQNKTVRIVSVVAVIFLPPTVIASAYGMNFANMPELDWRFGYPMALALMLASAVGTYLLFKWKRWL